MAHSFIHSFIHSFVQAFILTSYIVLLYVLNLYQREINQPRRNVVYKLSKIENFGDRITQWGVGEKGAKFERKFADHKNLHRYFGIGFVHVA